MKNIVDTKLHPISTSIDYINDCKKKLESNSILKLDNFLLPNILQDIQNEANENQNANNAFSNWCNADNQ